MALRTRRAFEAEVLRGAFALAVWDHRRKSGGNTIKLSPSKGFRAVQIRKMIGSVVLEKS
jgi:hypothetical protein